jgi:hypothetical protein
MSFGFGGFGQNNQSSGFGTGTGSGFTGTAGGRSFLLPFPIPFAFSPYPYLPSYSCHVLGFSLSGRPVLLVPTRGGATREAKKLPTLRPSPCYRKSPADHLDALATPQQDKECKGFFESKSL